VCVCVPIWIFCRFKRELKKIDQSIPNRLFFLSVSTAVIDVAIIREKAKKNVAYDKLLLLCYNRRHRVHAYCARGESDLWRSDYECYFLQRIIMYDVYILLLLLLLWAHSSPAEYRRGKYIHNIMLFPYILYRTMLWLHEQPIHVRYALYTITAESE